MSILYLTQMEYEQLYLEGALSRYQVLRDGRFYCIEIDHDDLHIHQALAHILIHIYETKYIRKLLIQDFYFTDEQELSALIKYVRFLLNDGDIMEEEVSEIKDERLKEIQQELQSYLLEAKSLYLEGFFRFRLQKVWRSYSKIIENAIDEYMMEKEYRDYINYLRALVRDRQMQLSYIHLLYREEDFYLFLNERGEEINFEQLYTLSCNDGELEIMYDDQLITRLIAVNPKEIQIHNIHCNHHIAISLKNIFEERLSICTGCSMCIGGIEHRG